MLQNIFIMFAKYFFECSLDWVPYTTMLLNIFTMFAKYFLKCLLDSALYTTMLQQKKLQCLQTIF